MNKVTVTLQNPLNKADTLDYIIAVEDTELGSLWYTALEDILRRNLYLEKNFCFLGFPDTPRDLEFICRELTTARNQINSFFDPDDYHIDETYYPDTLRTGLIPNQSVMNKLHNHFEHLQGTVWGLSDWYKRADYETKFAIRQLNNLCHEAESLMLSQRKKATQPEWVRPSQITTFLNAPRYDFPQHLKQTFSEAAYDRKLGQVFLHWTQIGKTVYEVYRDEVGVDIDAATCDAITHLRYYSGEFDIEWAQDIVYSGPHPWHDKDIDGFRLWLDRNGISASDAEINYGYHSVGQVLLQESFGTTDFQEIASTLSGYLDICGIRTANASQVYTYSYTDSDYKQQQIERLRPGYDYSSRG
jgi:hypothetical protein